MDCEKKPEYLERTNAHTGENIQTPHSKAPAESQTRDLVIVR